MQESFHEINPRSREDILGKTLYGQRGVETTLSIPGKLAEKILEYCNKIARKAKKIPCRLCELHRSNETDEFINALGKFSTYIGRFSNGLLAPF